jgi:hypothetical protein
VAKFNKETNLTSWDFMMHRVVAKGYCTIGELNTTISCNDLLKYIEILDFIEDREKEYQDRNRGQD